MAVQKTRTTSASMEHGAGFVPNDASRPEHLPDFRTPPLNEVVLGVQFAPPKGYQQIHAGEVWNLFRAGFPRVEEHPPLPPAFETFGLPSKGVRVGIVTGATHDRFWFLRPDGDELIQFQQDRLLHNWRKVGDQTNPYPRFESMSERFKSELDQLERYFNGLSPQGLAINQCEISYVNHIALESDQGINASGWLRFLAFDDKEPEDFTCNFHYIIRDGKGNPLGRLICEALTGNQPNEHRLIVLSLTFRGVPKEPSAASALKFLAMGRELIVCRFAELTTAEAHEKWGRIK